MSPSRNPETVSRQWVTAGIFDVLGVKPIAGRTFNPEDEAQMARRIVISEGFWQTSFRASWVPLFQQPATRNPLREGLAKPGARSHTLAR